MKYPFTYSCISLLLLYIIIAIIRSKHEFICLLPVPHLILLHGVKTKRMRSTSTKKISTEMTNMTMWERTYKNTEKLKLIPFFIHQKIPFHRCVHFSFYTIIQQKMRVKMGNRFVIFHMTSFYLINISLCLIFSIYFHVSFIHFIHELNHSLSLKKYYYMMEKKSFINENISEFSLRKKHQFIMKFIYYEDMSINASASCMLFPCICTHFWVLQCVLWDQFFFIKTSLVESTLGSKFTNRFS